MAGCGQLFKGNDMKEILIRDEKDTESFGLELAESLRPGDVLALVGDLGTGKTTLTKYIAKGLGITDMITSPTFTIVNEYHTGRLPLYHFDAYRFGGASGGDSIINFDEVFESGIEEYFYKDGVCVVEWAELIAEILPAGTKCIFMEYGDEPGARIYRIEDESIHEDLVEED